MKLNDHDGLARIGNAYSVLSILGGFLLAILAMVSWSDYLNPPRFGALPPNVYLSDGWINAAAAIGLILSGSLVKGVLKWMVGIYRLLAFQNGITEAGNRKQPDEQPNEIS